MIKWLIATKETQGQRPNDFNFCNEREVVLPSIPCHNGEEPDDTCGCGRSWCGMETRKGTTTMQVVALPWDPCDLIKAALKSYEKAGFTVNMSTEQRMEFDILRLLDIVDDEFHYGDIVEYRGTKGLQLRRAYHPTHTYQCPACLSHEHIDICADIWVRLVQSSPDNFETDIDEAHNHDHEWDGNHGAVCQNCNFGFNVDKFETEDWRPAEEDDDEPEDDRYCAEPLCCQEPEPNRSYCVHHSHLEEKYKCQNCGEMWSEEKLKPISHLEQRVAAGEPMPAGECPGCGALCHEEMGDDEPGPCTTCGTQCEGDGTGDVICPKCSQTEEGKERL